MTLKFDEQGNRLSEMRQRCKRIDDESYYYHKGNSIWFSDEGEGIFVADVERINRNPNLVSDIVTSLNEALK